MDKVEKRNLGGKKKRAVPEAAEESPAPKKLAEPRNGLFQGHDFSSMVRKRTQPTLIHMPRRDPSRQLSSRPIEVSDRIAKLQQEQRGQRRYHLARTPAQRSVSVLVRPQRRRRQRVHPPARAQVLTSVPVTPNLVKVSTLAREPFSLLREILSERTKEPKPEDYTSQIPVYAESRDIHRSRPKPAFPGFKLHRLWKLKAGLYTLMEWDQTSREVLLRDRNNVFRTPLPAGVVEPPAGPAKTYLEIGRQEDEQRRVSVKWVSV